VRSHLEPTLIKVRHPRVRTSWLYFLALAREFRWTLVALAACVVVGGVSYRFTPHEGVRASWPVAFYGGWMALLAQPLYSPPAAWYLLILQALYPLLGFVLIGEGIIRFALLMISRRLGEKEWMRVMASTYRDHVVLCGIGHLGLRVLQELVRAGVPTVVLEKEEGNRNMAAAKELGVPVLVRDMKEDQALIDAGIPTARAVVIATNDYMANLEVALDSRRMNPRIRIIMRLFDQQLAAKLSGVLGIDVAFSSSALAAPSVAKLAMENNP
jgi:voltage-gated potassium channel